MANTACALVVNVGRDGSKKAAVILSRKDEATLEAIMKATDWQAHSVRGFISGALIKKSGLKVESFKRRTASAPTRSELNRRKAVSPGARHTAPFLVWAGYP